MKLSYGRKPTETRETKLVIATQSSLMKSSSSFLSSPENVGNERKHLVLGGRL